MSRPASNGFWSRDYFLLWQGQVVSQIGDAFYMLAVFWFVYKQTGSPLATGTVMTFFVLPFPLLGPLAGKLIDRCNKKYILAVCDLIRGVIVLAVTWLAWKGMLTVPMLYAAVFLGSCCSVFFNPTVTASIPRLVRPRFLVRANSLGEFSRNLASVISPLAGGVVIAFLGVTLAFFINGVSYFLSGLSELFISRDPLAPSPGQIKSRISVGETLAKLREKAALFRLILASLIINFFGMAVVLVPILAVGRLKGGSMDLGVFSASYSVGSVLALGVLSFYGQRLNKGKVIGPLLAVFGAGMIYMGFNLTFYSVAVVMAVLGFCGITTRMNYITIMQENIDPLIHGRAFGLILSADTGLQPLTYLVTGALAESAGLGAALCLFGFFVLAGAVYLIRLPGLAGLSPPGARG